MSDCCDWPALVAIRPKVMTFARKLTRTKWDAEDLADDALLRAYERREQFAAGTNLTGWLCTIALNIFRSRTRRAWRETLTDQMFERRAPDDPEAGLHLADTLFNLSRLPPDQIECVVLAARGLSREEVAQVTGAAEGTIKSRTWRGREALKAAA